MTFKIITASQDSHTAQIRDLFREYLQWGNRKLNEEFGVNLDIETMLADDMQRLDKFMPPDGRLLLGYAGDSLAGVACLKYLSPGIGEIKRMYVRPGNRKRGLGRALINRLVAEATRIGYKRLRLDSARFMIEAHQLYRSTGFYDIDPYEGSEIPIEFQKHWVFLQIELSGKESEGIDSAGPGQRNDSTKAISSAVNSSA